MSLFDTAKQKKLAFFRHVMRHDTLKRDLLEGMVEVRRKQQTEDTVEWQHYSFDRPNFHSVQAYGSEQTEMEVYDRQRQSTRHVVRQGKWLDY